MTPAPFTGWLRPKAGTWRRVCRADTEAACLALLRAESRRVGGDVDLLVTNTGRHPEHRKKPR